MSPPETSPGSDEERLLALGPAIAAWFAAGHRDLPWRKSRDPYSVWVSEIMLQQTRVDVVSPRFVRWMARFPTVQSLAAAPLDDVLAEWAGLGYYARARNLHLAARTVVEQYAGRVPDDKDAIARLPGIGRYTAGAILSIAHGQRVPLLDGNVQRVLARVFRVAGDPKSSAVSERLWGLATRLIEGKEDPSHVNQGLMELGALVCSPQRPACLACPAMRLCAGRLAGEAEVYPGGSKKQVVRPVEQVAVAILRGRRVLLMRRPPEGLWGGLFELPSGELLAGESPTAAAIRIARERAGLGITSEGLRGFAAPNDRFVQELSHLRITFHALRAANPSGRVRRSGYDAHEWFDYSRAKLIGVARSTQRLLAALADESTLETTGRSAPSKRSTPE